MAALTDSPAISQALDVLRERGVEAGYKSPDVIVSLGGCIEACGTARKGAFRRRAHAHSDSRDLYRWTICVLSGDESRLVTATGRPTALFCHEYAHLLTPSDWHGERWGRAVAALGAPNEYKRLVKIGTRKYRK